MVIRGLAVVAALTGAAAAQETSMPAAGTLNLELNAAIAQPGACRMMFLAENSLAADLSSVVIEAVIFDAQGKVERLALFDLQSLPAGRKRVRSFDLAGADCAALSSVLVNAVTACAGGEATPDTCQQALRVTSRVAGMDLQG